MGKSLGFLWVKAQIFWTTGHWLWVKAWIFWTNGQWLWVKAWISWTTGQWLRVKAWIFWTTGQWLCVRVCVCACVPEREMLQIVFFMWWPRCSSGKLTHKTNHYNSITTVRQAEEGYRLECHRTWGWGTWASPPQVRWSCHTSGSETVPATKPYKPV